MNIDCLADIRKKKRRDIKNRKYLKMLFIAPLPPPINGQSLASSIIYQQLAQTYKMVSINTSKSIREVKIMDYYNRSLDVIRILYRAYLCRHTEKFYLSLSESFQGNLKDVILLLILYPNLKNGIIHMLGGANMKILLESNSVRARLTIHLFSKVGSVIVEGIDQRNSFSNVQHQNIYVVNNFVESHLYSVESLINIKHSDTKKLRILFLSNMLPGKGYKELLKGFMQLDHNIQNKYEIVFVGGFRDSQDKKEFMVLLNSCKNAEYHGVFIDGDEKRRLYYSSHIFALPSYYPFEGQPISILEAYANGCYVIATQHSGIKDIFDASNGSIVIEQSSDSIRECLNALWKDPIMIKTIGDHNYAIAKEKYTIRRYRDDINNIVIKDL